MPQNIKTVCLRWNLKPRLIRICWIWWWCLLFLFWTFMSKYVRKNPNCLSRHFCLVTKSRIFKNLNLRRRSNCNVPGKLLQNHFRHLQLWSNPESWLARSCCHLGNFRKTNGWSSHFCQSHFFTFYYERVHYKRRLNR